MKELTNDRLFKTNVALSYLNIMAAIDEPRVRRIKSCINCGYSVAEIARVMNLNESTVRSIIKKYNIKESE